MGFTKNKADSNLYYKVEYGNLAMILLYVDDLFVTGMDGLIADMKRNLPVEFEMKDLGMMYCKELTKLMASNLKLLSDASSEGIDAMMY